MTSLFSPLFAAHRHALLHYPYRTNMAQSGSLMALGDSLAQYLERRGAPDDAPPHVFSRTAILASWASCVNAPFWCWFYKFLNRRLPGQIVAWVALSASLSPAFNAAFFSYSTAAAHVVEEGVAVGLGADGRGRLAGKVRERLETTLVPTVQRSMMLWLPFNYFNFRYVPLDYRALTGSSVALVWNVYLSLMASTARAHGPPPANVQQARAGADATSLR